MADNPAQEAAAGVLEDVFGEVPTEADPLVPVETNEAPEGEQPQEEEVEEFPEITWETPEELRDVLDQPDWDDDEEVEEFEGEGNVNYDPDEYDDPEKAAMAKKLAKMQKKLAWEQEQKAKQGRKLWADEARKYYQFSNPEVIQAKSRRAFLKEAERQHMAVAKVAKPIFDSLAAQRKAIKDQALAEAKAEAEQRWGRPTTGPTANVNLEDTQTTARKRLESSKGLKDVLRQKLNSGEVKL